MDIAKLDTAQSTLQRSVDARPRPVSQPADSARPAAPATTGDAGHRPVDEAELARAVETANAHLRSQQSSSIQFSMDQDSGRMVVKMVDNDTKEVLRQIPSEEMLAISRSMDAVEKQSGLVINEKA